MTNRPVVHVEIPSKDPKASARFFTEAFGWELQHLTEPVPYTTGQAGNMGVGIPDMGTNRKPGEVVIYVQSEDIDADLKKIETLGGKTIMPKDEVPGFGWLAMFSDLDGNTLALWTNMPGAMPG